MTEPIGRYLVVYDHPLDMPDCWMLRWWTIYPGKLVPDDMAEGFYKYETLRQYIDQNWPGLCRLPRQPGDDPAIYETWM